LVERFESNDIQPRDLRKLKKKLLRYPLWLAEDADLHWSLCDWNEAIVSELTRHVRNVAPEVHLQVLDEDAVKALFWQRIKRAQDSWKEAQPRFDPLAGTFESNAEGRVRSDGARVDRAKSNSIRNKKQFKFDERNEALKFILHNPDSGPADRNVAQQHLEVLSDLGRDAMSSDDDWIVEGAKVGYQRTVSTWRRRHVTFMADIWEEAVEIYRAKMSDSKLRRKPREPLKSYKNKKYYQRPLSTSTNKPPKGLPSNFYHTAVLKSWGQRKKVSMRVGKPKFVNLVPADEDPETDHPFETEL
jgi:hypothetical protein